MSDIDDLVSQQLKVDEGRPVPVFVKSSHNSYSVEGRSTVAARIIADASFDLMSDLEVQVQPSQNCDPLRILTFQGVSKDASCLQSYDHVAYGATSFGG